MRRRPVRWLAGLLAALAIGAAGRLPQATERRDPQLLHGAANSPAEAQLGCYQAEKSGRMTLFFGAPTAVRGEYGAALWGAPDLTSGTSAEQREGLHPRLRLLPARTPTTAAHRHGHQDQRHRRRDGRLAAAATGQRGRGRWRPSPPGPTTTTPATPRCRRAWDPEPSWSSFEGRAWMHGYDGTPGARPVRELVGRRLLVRSRRQQPVQQRVEPAAPLAPGLGRTTRAADPADLHHRREPGRQWKLIDL